MDVVDFAKHVYKKIDAREQEITEALLSGAPKDWEHYKTLTGEIRGLSFVRFEVETLLEKSSYYDEIDEPG